MTKPVKLFEAPTLPAGSLASRLRHDIEAEADTTMEPSTAQGNSLRTVDLDADAETVDQNLAAPLSDVEMAAVALFAEPTYGYLSMDKFKIDPRVQRPLQEPHVNRIARTWNKAALGTVIVSVRVNPDSGEEDNIVLDGQQRLEGSARYGYTGQVHVEFHRNLTLAQEALLFRLHNNKRAVSTLVKFNVSLLEGDLTPEGVLANRIESTLADLGIERNAQKGFNAVNMATRIASYENGLMAFRWALEVVLDAWKVKVGVDPAIAPTAVEALALLFLQNGTRIKRDRLVANLAANAHDEFELINSGRSRQRVHKGALVPNVINEIVRIYNKGLRVDGGNQLDEWNVKQRGPRVTGKKK